MRVLRWATAIIRGTGHEEVLAVAMNLVSSAFERHDFEQ
jgi:hypothetical protein